jgi:hypothetical protein
MLLFYPEIKEQMIKENPEYEKYFCYFNDQNLRKKKFQQWVGFFSVECGFRCEGSCHSDWSAESSRAKENCQEFF